MLDHFGGCEKRERRGTVSIALSASSLRTHDDPLRLSADPYGIAKPTIFRRVGEGEQGKAGEKKGPQSRRCSSRRAAAPVLATTP